MLNKCQPQNRTKYEKLCVVSVIIILKKVLVKLEKLKGIGYELVTMVGFLSSFIITLRPELAVMLLLFLQVQIPDTI